MTIRLMEWWKAYPWYGELTERQSSGLENR